jgi:hypothetical protein
MHKNGVVGGIKDLAVFAAFRFTQVQPSKQPSEQTSDGGDGRPMEPPWPAASVYANQREANT